jgi:hypothetical protein
VSTAVHIESAGIAAKATTDRGDHGRGDQATATAAIAIGIDPTLNAFASFGQAPWSLAFLSLPDLQKA